MPNFSFRRLSEVILGHSVTSQIVRGGGGSFALKLTYTFIRLGTGVLLARVLGAEGYGVYAYALAIVLLVNTPLKAGLSGLLVRMTATYQAESQWQLLRGLWRRGLQFAISVGFCLAAVFAVALWMFASGPTEGSSTTIILALFLIPLLATVQYFGGTLNGLRHVILGQIPEFLIRPGLFFFLLVGCLAIAGTGWLSPPLAVLLNISATGIALGVAVYFLKRRRPEEIAQESAEFRHRQWIATMLPLSLSAGTFVILRHIDLLVLGLYTESSDVGIYRVAVTVAALVTFPLYSMNAVLAPQIARLETLGERHSLQTMIMRSAQITLGLAAPLVLLFVLFGESVLSFVFGTTYGAGAVVLAVLCLGQFIHVAAGHAPVILNMTGHERDAAWAIGIAALLNLALNNVLIPIYGMEGAAIATAISYTVWSLMLLMRVYQRTGLNSTAFPFRLARASA